MTENLENFVIYKMSLQLWDDFWKDSDIMMSDIRGKEIVRQMTRSVYSISANIEEGYGRGFGKEYPQFLRYSTGSARETKGGYVRENFLLGDDFINQRIELIDKIISGLNDTLTTLKDKTSNERQ